jgi:hypothetical protein
MELVRQLHGTLLLHEPLDQDWAELFHGFLACEWNGDDGPAVRTLVASVLGEDAPTTVDRLVAKPDFSSAEDNSLREQVIRFWRWPLIVTLPQNCAWLVVRLKADEWERLLWFNHRTMDQVLADIEADAATTTARKVQDAMERLTRGEMWPGKPIAVTLHPPATHPLVLLDGNHRATAVAATVRDGRRPPNSELYVAVSPEMRQWHWYPQPREPE